MFDFVLVPVSSALGSSTGIFIPLVEFSEGSAGDSGIGINDAGLISERSISTLFPLAPEMLEEASSSSDFLVSDKTDEWSFNMSLPKSK